MEDGLNHGLHAFSELLNDLDSVRKPDDIYALVMSCLRRALRADRAAVLEVVPPNGLRFAASQGLSRAYRRRMEKVLSGSLPIEAHLTPFMASSLEDVSALPPARQALAREGIGALVALPLTHEGRLLGRCVAYFDRPREFCEEELALVKVVARYAGLAMGHALEEDRFRAAEDRLGSLADELVSALGRERAWFRSLLGEELAKREQRPSPGSARATRSEQARSLDLVNRIQSVVGTLEIATATILHAVTHLRPGVAAPAARDDHLMLSRREHQVLRLLGSGKSQSEIAAELSLSVKTVETYRRRVLQKLGLRTTTELIRHAVRTGVDE